MNRSSNLGRTATIAFFFCAKLVGAQNFESNWRHSEKICKLEGMVTCTAEELNETGSNGWTCGTEFHLRQQGSRICGSWWNGCSGVVKVYGGNVAGETTARNEAKVWLDGSVPPTSQSEPFPNQSAPAILRIDNERLVIEHDGAGLIFNKLERNPAPTSDGAIDKAFLSKCFAAAVPEH